MSIIKRVENRAEAERFLNEFGNAWRSSVWNYIRKRHG
jgi:hypothetical protein